MSMASFTFKAELVSTFFGFAYRNPKPFTPIQTTFVPLLCKTKTHSQSLSSYSFSRTFALNPTRGARRFTVTATTTAPPHTEGSDVSPAIPPDNRIPATIITGFLGSGKVWRIQHQ